ncbi:MAG: hypothetical protein CVV46_06695 [Spirochaetae bacterium HGW-Spirochaetae-2]|jgi:diguanylate cyclase (GGDEF)-like protein|nr:MAG: hypothetical protein CVV46_06695 [Spirochaetae bacterium HGW-Spirochaetae-2]
MTKRARRFFLLGLFLLLSTFLTLTGFMMVGTVNRLVAEDARVVLNEIANQSVVRLNSMIHSHINLLQFQAAFIGRYENIQDPEVIRILKTEVDDGRYLRIGVVLPDGSSVNSDGISNNIGYRQYLQQALLGESVVSEVLDFSLDPTIPIIVVAVPIFRDGNVVGVLRGVREVSTFAEMLQVTTYGASGYAYVVRKTGEVVLSNNSPDWELFSTDVPYAKIPQFSLDNRLRTMAASMRRNESGMIQLGTGESKRFVDYRPLGVNDWYVVSVISETLMMGKVASVIRITGITSLSVLALLFLLLLVFVLFRERRQELMERIAFNDDLTLLGTWKRLKFETRNRLKDLARKNYWYVLVDIDRFKLVNSMAGYMVGNYILQEMARVLRSLVNPDEFVVRVVNDRFALMLRADGNIDKRISGLLGKLDTISKDGMIEAYGTISLTYSCGVYPIGEHDSTLEAIHDKAQLALESVKASRISTYAYYDETLHMAMQRQQELEGHFSAALAANEFEVYLQPKFHVESMTIAGAEALVRWNHPDRGFLLPIEFISFLEENSRIGELDTYVLRKVCELHTRWEQLKYPRLPISVNVSRVHAMTHQFIEKYDGILNEYDIPKNLIEIELTETAFSNDPDKVIETVGKLRALGFSISLDDFGTGYSSLNLLKDLKVDIIKIDRLFLKDFASESRSEIIIRHVLNLADDLGMVVVAEGVESEMQLKFLLSVGCHQAQGFLLAEPMPIDTFLEYWHPSVSR